MKAKLPKKITIGNTEYTVERKYMKRPRNRRGDLGLIEYDARQITVTTQDSFGNRLPKEQQTETFWHELTHGILHAMGQARLRDNEAFVTKFAKHLNKAVLSAKFE